MEKMEILYKEYVKLVERYNTLLDSSFNDIKLYSVIGSALGLIGIIRKGGIDLNFINTTENEIYKVYFVIILFLFFLIAIIAYRDLLKQVYIVHISYNIKKMEDYLNNKYFEDIEIFNLRKSWTEKYYSLMKITYSAFTIVFFLPIILFPIYLFISDSEGTLKYGIVLSSVMILILIIYSFLIYKIYEEAQENEA